MPISVGAIIVHFGQITTRSEFELFILYALELYADKLDILLLYP